MQFEDYVNKLLIRFKNGEELSEGQYLILGLGVYLRAFKEAEAEAEYE